MPTFAQLLGERVGGLVWLLDISFDDFATVSYRWSTASVLISGNAYDGRIASMTPIERGFGRDHLPAASTTKLRIENSDFGADWLVDRVTVGSSLLKARFRLIAHLYDADVYTLTGVLSGASQTLGVFVCLDQPEAMESAVDLALADDSLGRLAEPLTTPTVRDWKDAAVSLLADPSTNPFNTNEPVPQMDWDVPLPLVFGMGAIDTQVPAYAAVAQYNAYQGPPYTVQQMFVDGLVPPVRWPIVVCAAKANTQPAGVDELVGLYGTFGDDIEGRPDLRGLTLDIPRNGEDLNHVTRELWRPRRSAVFSKGGRDWQVVWLEFNVDNYVAWFKAQFPDIRTTESGGVVLNSPVPIGGAGSPAVAASGGLALESRGHVMAAFSAFHVRAGARGHLSMVSTRHAEDFGVDVPSLRLVDMIHDVIAYYSRATLADIDTAAFERASKARATVLGAGVIQPSRPRPLTSIQRNGWISPNPRDGIVGVLRTALGEMCGSCDVDLFMTKEGLYSLSTNVFDYEAVTATRVATVESRTKRVRTKTPSQGERWAPYNRVNLIGPGGASFGPYDNQDAIDEWGITLPVTLQAKWNARLWGENSAAGASTVWAYRTLESKVRPFVRFNADREYLGFELGEYFEFSWTRGGQSAFFSDVVFRLESMRIDPGTLGVELGAIWADDLATDQPFLLDDEEFLTRWDGAGGGTLTVEDSNVVAQLSGGGLIAAGVTEGDILVLKDSTQAANEFTRYREIRIAGVIADDQIDLSGADDDFDAPGGFAIAAGDWYITLGVSTYPTAASDPVNYPSDGNMYGKCCDANNVYSIGGVNKLLDG